MTLRITRRRINNGAIILRSLAVYGRQPHRLDDIRKWVRDRNTSSTSARLPWWPYSAIERMRELVRRGDRVFEYGGGGSSLWLYDSGAELTVVEHDREWFEELRRILPDDVRVDLREPTRTGSCRSRFHPGEEYFDDYVRAIEDAPDSSMDLVIVDGRSRVACGLASMTKVKLGGRLLLDDSNRSRYQELHEVLSSWRREDFYGVKPGGIGPARRTSLWQRPSP